MAYDFSINTFNLNLKNAYNPDLTKEDKANLLNYFLAYKSEVIGHSDGCPSSVENAIQHLKDCIKPTEIVSPHTNTTSWQDNIIHYIVVGVVVILVGNFFWHLIIPLLKE